MASACSPRASGGVEDVATAAAGPPASAAARLSPCDPSKARMQGRQSEGVWKTTARGSLSRRNGNKKLITGRGPATPHPPHLSWLMLRKTKTCVFFPLPAACCLLPAA